MSALPEIEKPSVFSTDVQHLMERLCFQTMLPGSNITHHLGLRVCALCRDEVERQLQKGCAIK